MTLFIQVLFGGLTTGSIYSLVAFGFTIIYMVSRVLNIAQGEFLMIGGLTFYSFLRISSLPMPAIFLASIGVVILVGVVVYKIVIDPFVSVDVSREVPIMRFILITISGFFYSPGRGVHPMGVGTAQCPPFLR